ncbi:MULTISPECIES: class I SAM-dependent methyltransferase [unclassified Arthrobacter]|uniref:class I SAM-dependent methyltransferase n=1 Tax=unclassified Arthrobacter TaxID=235627 RepID=UPI002E0FEB59|nr:MULTISPECIES: class I SAM-dependent methyltransferase [unclassified Arthrobacter]
MTTIGADKRGPSNWAGVGRSYSQSFAHLCAGAIVPLLDATEALVGGFAGRPLADVGCGTGNLTALATSRGAEVTGIDPDVEMLALARAAAPQAELLRGGVPNLPFAPDTFDAVMANFVVNHVGNPRAAVADLKRVCRPRGVVAVTIWPSELSAINRLWSDVVEASGATVPGQQKLPADMDFDRTEQGLNELLAGAGLDAVETKTLAWDFTVDAEDLWAGPAGGVGGIGKIVTSQTPSMQSAMRHEYLRLVSPMLRNGKVVLPAVALLGIGQTRQPDLPDASY